MDVQHASINARYGAVRFLLGRLDRSVTLRLFDHYADRPGADRAMTSELGEILLEVVSGRRRSHAQRLWAGWLQPAPLHDDGAPDRPSGGIDILDLAAWWQVLETRMPDEVALAQAFVAERVRLAPLNRVLTSADAKRWAHRLSRRGLEVLAALRDEPTACAAALAEANLALRDLIGHGPGEHRRLGLDDLDRLIALLRDASQRCAQASA